MSNTGGRDCMVDAFPTLFPLPLTVHHSTVSCYRHIITVWLIWGILDNKTAHSQFCIRGNNYLRFGNITLKKLVLSVITRRYRQKYVIFTEENNSKSSRHQNRCFNPWNTTLFSYACLCSTPMLIRFYNLREFVTFCACWYISFLTHLFKLCERLMSRCLLYAVLIVTFTHKKSLKA